MEEQNIPWNEVTKAMVLQSYRLTGEHTKAIDYLQQENDASLTPYLFAIGTIEYNLYFNYISNDFKGISMAQSCDEACRLLKRALQLRKADAAVFTATAKICITHGEFERGADIY